MQGNIRVLLVLVINIKGGAGAGIGNILCSYIRFFLQAKGDHLSGQAFEGIHGVGIVCIGNNYESFSSLPPDL